MLMDGWQTLNYFDKIESKMKAEYENKCKYEKLGKYEKPKTNADRIRSMTDEELAEFINDVAWDEICSECDEDYECQDNSYCELYVLKWLQKDIK